jgi:hypothetical protein
MSNQVEIKFMIGKLNEWNEQLGGSQASISSIIQNEPSQIHNLISYRNSSYPKDILSKNIRI